MALVVVKLQQLRNHLGVRLRTEMDSLIDKELLDLHIVLDDAVVDDGELTALAQMRMCVDVIGGSVGRPSGVTDTDTALHIRAAVTQAAEHLQASLGLANVNFMAGRHHRDTGRVIATVLQTAQSIQQNRRSLLLSDEANDSTHR